MSKRTIDQVDVAGRRVLMRVDFNVPIDDGVITEDHRIRAALPSIRSVLDRGGRLVLMSHLGRPKGVGPEPGLSLAPVATRLDEILGEVRGERTPVSFASDCVGPVAEGAVDALPEGGALLLENLRFHAAEKGGDPAFARRLAALADVYCNDAFGTAHRDDASMLAVPEAMEGRPRVCGFLLEKELRYLSETIRDASARGAGHGFVAVLGGAKVSDKLGAIAHLTGRVDHILIGGAMAYTFLRAQGVATGASRVEEDRIADAAAMIEAAKASTTRLVLPSEHVCGRALEAGTPVAEMGPAIADGWMGLDIGAAAIGRFGEILADAQTIVWNGPMGVFEVPPFDAGTRRVGDAIAGATDGGAVSVIGGGDTAAAITAFGLADRVSHVSTGGGASLRMLEGEPFASVAVLDDA